MVNENGCSLVMKTQIQAPHFHTTKMQKLTPCTKHTKHAYNTKVLDSHEL
jgi:hypothetical protein